MSKRSKPSSKRPSGQPRLRCFVAMAFGREDTDAVYDDHIKKAIEAANMTPIRVDRVVHLDRIDAKIRKEVENADIVVADLTYARPSVYWEAGYAERQSPVIYTCRADHLQPDPADKYGNYQVHFDLKNANIITWSGKEDSVFQENLRQTLLYASRPIQKRKGQEQSRKLIRQEFSSKSQTEKIKLINKATDDALSGLGYRAIPKKHWFFDNHGGGGGTRYPTFWKKVGSTSILLTRFGCSSSLTQKELEHQAFRFMFKFARFVVWEELPDFIVQQTRRRIKAQRRLILFSVLQAVPQNRIANVLPDWRRNGSYLHYSYHHIAEHSGPRRQNVTSIASSSELLILDKISSPPEYSETLSQALSNIEELKTTIVSLSR